PATTSSGLIPDRHSGGNALTSKSNASSGPPTTGSDRPRCTAPPFGTPPHAVTDATARIAKQRERRLDTGRLPPRHRPRRRQVGALAGIERQRRFADVEPGSPRQREPEHRAGADLAPGLQPAAVQ